MRQEFVNNWAGQVAGDEIPVSPGQAAMSSRWFKALLADVANGLTPSDLEIIRYLHELRGSQSPQDTLHALSQRRVFSERNTEPLVKLLDEIGRADLAELCRERVRSTHA